MKKELFMFILLFLGIIIWGGNAGATPQGEDNGAQMTASGKPYSCEGTLFQYDGNEYNIRELIPAINSIMSCVPVGNHIVLNGHVGPRGGIYLIFNTETKEFEKDIEGSNLIWSGDDIRTAVYSSYSDIYAYDGRIIASIDLPENAFIKDLAFVDNNTKIEVSIFELPGKMQTVLVPIHGGVK